VTYELQQENISSQLLKQYVLEGSDFCHCIMTSGKGWFHHFDLAEKQQSIE
jgi:hypothetical protein